MIEDENEADSYVHAVTRDWRTAPISDADKSLCSYAEKLTRHQNKIQKADIDELRTKGFNDRAIHDATQVIGFYNHITRIANGLGVEPESWIQHWGDNLAKKD